MGRGLHINGLTRDEFNGFSQQCSRQCELVEIKGAGVARGHVVHRVMPDDDGDRHRFVHCFVLLMNQVAVTPWHHHDSRLIVSFHLYPVKGHVSHACLRVLDDT